LEVRSKIEPALCFKQQRTVDKDNTITFEGTVFQIPKQSPYCSFANKRLDIHVLLNGVATFFYQKKKSSLRSQNNAQNWLISNDRQAGSFRYGPLSALATKTLELSP
jgi:hypothetical protein